MPIKLPIKRVQTNIKSFSSKKPIDEIAGPGHKPDIAHPIPKIAAPVINLPSRLTFEGNSKISVKIGLGRFKINLNVRAVTNTAPPITNAKLGSQLPVMSKNPTIFAGLIILETARPKPNKSPDVRLKTLSMIQAPVKLRTTKTVIPAVTIKVIVAVSDRIENRPRPQTPWPLVQPEPIWLPKPTNNPPRIMKNM